jgi:SAM-dependent methyltransferase
VAGGDELTQGFDQDRIWDYFQREAPEQFAGSVRRLSFLASNAPGPRVLNIGVGTGVFEETATAGGLEVYSLDPIEESIGALKDRLQMGDRARVGYSTEIPFEDDFFDSVVASELFEHLSEQELAGSLPEIARVLRPGGLLLGTVPAREDLGRQTVVCPHCGERFHRWGHRQSFDVTAMRSVLKPHFEVQRVFERPFISWRTLNWKGKTVGAVKMLLHRLRVRGSNENIVFMATKR